MQIYIKSWLLVLQLHRALVRVHGDFISSVLGLYFRLHVPRNPLNGKFHYVDSLEVWHILFKTLLKS